MFIQPTTEAAEPKMAVDEIAALNQEYNVQDQEFRDTIPLEGILELRGKRPSGRRSEINKGKQEERQVN